MNEHDHDLAEPHRLRRPYREAPIGLCCFDTQLRYTEINDWLAALNGLSVEEHLGCYVSELFPNLAAQIESQLRRVIETGEPILAGSAFAETPAQPSIMRYFQHNYIAMKSDDGTIVGVSCAVEEITERKRAEAALAMRKDAVQPQKMAQRQTVQKKLNLLTKEERAILRMISSGHLNKQVAAALDVSLRTVESRRKRIMRKLEVESLAELMRFVIEAENI